MTDWLTDFAPTTLREAVVRLRLEPLESVSLSLCAAMSAVAFDTAKHPRGQPTNRGQFGNKGNAPSAGREEPQTATSPEAADRASPEHRGTAIIARYSAKLSHTIDRVPVVGLIKQRMSAAMGKIHAAAAKRYGPKTAAAIMASGTVMDMALMAGGVAVTGVPVVTGVNQLIGIIPAFALAEVLQHLTGGAKFAILETDIELDDIERDVLRRAAAEAIAADERASQQRRDALAASLEKVQNSQQQLTREVAAIKTSAPLAIETPVMPDFAAMMRQMTEAMVATVQDTVAKATSRHIESVKRDADERITSYVEVDGLGRKTERRVERDRAGLVVGTNITR